jgi:hypothetical protein
MPEKLVLYYWKIQGKLFYYMENIFEKYVFDYFKGWSRL